MKGNIHSNTTQPIRRITNVMGNIICTQSPKPISMFSPAGSFRYFSAMPLGGVPMGVAMPPILAPRGIAMAKAMRPLPFSGNALSTGPRNANIMAAVAVLLMKAEKSAVTTMKPKSTIGVRLPKG